MHDASMYFSLLTSQMPCKISSVYFQNLKTLNDSMALAWNHDSCPPVYGYSNTYEWIGYLTTEALISMDESIFALGLNNYCTKHAVAIQNLWPYTWNLAKLFKACQITYRCWCLISICENSWFSWAIKDHSRQSRHSSAIFYSKHQLTYVICRTHGQQQRHILVIWNLSSWSLNLYIKIMPIAPLNTETTANFISHMHTLYKS